MIYIMQSNEKLAELVIDLLDSIYFVLRLNHGIYNMERDHKLQNNEDDHTEAERPEANCG